MSNDRALGLQVPKYDEKNFVVPADLAYWEAVYTDGTVLRETDGKKYADIDRGSLQSFRIVHHGEIMLSIWPDPVRGSTGYNLVYRRRTAITGGMGRAVIILLGFAPMGPIYALDLANSQFSIHEGFEPGDQTVYPPVAFPYEPRMLATE